MYESMQPKQTEKNSPLHRSSTAKLPMKKKNQSLLTCSSSRNQIMTGIGKKTREPMFNFVNCSSTCSSPKNSPTPSSSSPSFHHSSSHGATATTTHDLFDRVVYETIAECAASLSGSTDPTTNSNSFSQEEKMAKIWNSLLRHSESGRFNQMAQEISHAGQASPSTKFIPPNAFCTSLCLRIVQNTLRLVGMPPFLLNMIIGGLSNSIYANYDPSRSFQEHTQYATLAEKFRNQRLSQLELAKEPYEDKIDLATSLIESMEEENRPSGITEILSPLLSENLLLVLWNATATSTASNVMQESSSATSSPTAKSSVRARASVFAGMVLQERVRLMLTFWQTLTQGEHSLLFSALQTANQAKPNDNLSLGEILRSLEDTYAAEQDREAESRSSSSNSNDSFQGDDQSNSLVPIAPPPRNSRQISSGALSPRQKTSKALLHSMSSQRRRSSHAQLTKALTIKTAVNSQLLLSFEDKGSSSASSFRGTAPTASTDSTRGSPSPNGMSTEEVNALLKSHEFFEQEVLSECEDIFDILCDESRQSYSADRTNPLDPHHLTLATSSMAKAIQGAKVKLKDLLCNYLEDTEIIQEKFEKSEIRQRMRPNGGGEEGTGEADKVHEAGNEEEKITAALVHAVIEQCQSRPQLLVHCFNQSPEILLRAISKNYGILRFAIAKNPSVVKKFLSLDQKASENLDLIIMKNKGIQLLWGSNENQHHRFIQEISPISTTGTSATGALNELLEQWFVSHLTELSVICIDKPELVQQLFVQMERTTDDPVKLYKMMLQLRTVKAVETFVKRMSMDTMERLMEHDVATITRLVRDIVLKGKEDGLFEKLKETPTLALCLAEYDPKNVEAIFTAHPETWQPFFVNAAAQHDAVLREALALRTKGMEGSDFLVDFFTSVVNRMTATALAQLRQSTGGIQTEDCITSSQTTSKRRCLFLQQRTVFGALGSVVINSTDFHPGHLMVQVKPSALINALGHYQGKTGKGGGHRSKQPKAVPLQSTGMTTPSAVTSAAQVVAAPATTAGKSKKKKPTVSFSNVPISNLPSEDIHYNPHLEHQQQQENGGSTSSSVMLTSIPTMWQPLISRFHCRHPERDTPKLTKPHLRILLLDILLEFIKIDETMNENECLWGLAPFVCDYFMNRYDDRDVVGSWLSGLVESLHKYQTDPRAKLFASACGLTTSHIPYDMFLYYLQALDHILYGQMKVYVPENRLEERRDGTCPIPRSAALAATSVLFGSLLPKADLKLLRDKIEDIPALKKAPTNQEIEIELDQILGIYLEEWESLQAKLDEQYRLSFKFNSNGNEIIDLEQFTRIIRAVTNGDVTARECRMIYFDVGLEYLDIETLLQITHAYHLRSLHVIPPVLLPNQDLQLLQDSLGRFNIHCTEREIEDLHIYWRSVYHDIQVQIEALHQKRSMKKHLQQHKQTIEGLLKDIDTTGTTMSKAASTVALAKVWDEIRACVKTLNAAKLLQRYLSGVYLQCCMAKWIRNARKKNQQEREQNEDVQAVTGKAGTTGTSIYPPHRPHEMSTVEYR